MATINYSLWDLIKSVPKRIIEVVIKLLSLKGVVFATSVFLMIRGALDVWGFVAIVGMVMFDKTFLKYMDKLK